MGKAFFNRNNNIVLANIVSACLLLFCCCFFFFLDPKLFLNDITSYMIFSPIILALGVGFICFYIFKLTFNLDSNTSFVADRYDIWYKIIFTITLLTIMIRSFFGDFMCTDPSCHCIQLNVPVPIIVFGIISGIITWCTPKIKDNNNTEF